MESMVDLKADDNPWDVKSIYEFNFFCCPECDCKSSSKQDFVIHASQSHPRAIDALKRISDGSLNDVDIPQEDIKLEDDISIKDELDDDGTVTPEVLLDYDEDEPLMRKVKKRQKHNGESRKPYSCDLCNFYAKSATQLVSHVKKKHTENIALTCTECKVKCSSCHTLKKHMWNIHKIGRGSEKCLCSLCGKTIVGRSNFKKHEREKHGIISATFVRRRKQIKIECTKCMMKFESAKALNSHAKECEEEAKDFPCMSCESKWVSGPVLNIHLKTDHNYPEMYTCDICGKCLKKKASMDSHIKVEHEKKKDHICHLCGTGFARAQGLRFHMQRIHEHSGRYACEYCSFRTVAQLQLDIHVNAVHTKATKFHCEECNFFCYHRQGLLAHVKTVHLKLKPHQCTKCLEAYVRRKDLEKHKETTGHHDTDTDI